MTDQYNYCQVVGQTDVGRKRTANEDSMGNAVTRNGLVSVVCDGMGGHVGGATASRIAVNAILENLDAVYYDDPRIAIGESIDIANRAILNEAAAHPELSGMGSTCVLLIVRDGKVYIGHVGDSRIYLIRSKRIIQLTKDHSYVQMLVDRGEITKEQAEHHRRKNEITNALGIPDMSPATVADDAIIPEAGDCFLLCSDGLSGMVSNEVICKVISRQSEMNAQDRVNRLVSLANENGGIDNITAQMVEFPVAPGVAEPDKKLPLWLKILVPALLVAAVGAGAYLLSRKGKKQEEEKHEEAVVNTQEDIRPVVNLGKKVTFSKDSELLTIVFGEDSVAFMQGNRQVYIEHRAAMDASTLTVESPEIDVLLRKPSCILKFTDKSPGNRVLFTVKSKDGKTVYRYGVSIANGTIKPAGNKKQKKSEGSKAEKDAAPAEQYKAQTVEVNLSYTELKQDDVLLFNYSAKPRFILHNCDFPVGETLFDEIMTDKVVYDKSIWKAVFTTDRKQLKFIFTGESSDKDCSFTIPCFKKGSASDIVLLQVKLSCNASDENEEGRKNDSPSEDKKDGLTPEGLELKEI